jgi:hypothetical protein
MSVIEIGKDAANKSLHIQIKRKARERGTPGVNQHSL